MENFLIVIKSWIMYCHPTLFSKFCINFLALLSIISLPVFSVCSVTDASADILEVPSQYKTIQAAIDAANEGDEVQVASSGSPYTENITLKSGVEVIGAGADTTTIQGDGTNWVVTAENVNKNTLIQGFKITGGKGGIRCKDSELAIYLNHITGNLNAHMGGGIYIEKGASPVTPTIQDNIIDNNTAKYGGGICSDYANPTIQGNDIFENHAVDWGGGIFMQDSSGTVTENNIYLNTASWGGGIFCEASSTNISGNVIDRNSVNARGGGIHCRNSEDAPVKRNPTISQNTISNNQGAVWGGGISAYPKVSPVIQRNSIINNSAENGAGIYIADASDFFFHASIVNNVLYGNMANGSDPDHQTYCGGGIYLSNLTENGEPDIINNTFFGNYAATSGGGISCNSTIKPIIFNCILWNNTDDLDGCTATYSNIQDGDGNGTNGNISINPLFKDTANFDCSLASRSPCLDAGTDTGAPSTDRDGNPRPVDGNNDSIAHTDMGAYESVGYEGPVTIYVSTTGDDILYGKGDSANPFRTITMGIDVSLSGDTVQVAAGTYNEEISLKSGVVLQGAGAEVTTLQGSGTGPHVVRAIAADANTRIDGFTITGGIRDGDGHEGSGIYCEDSSLTISSNIIHSCEAEYGGGIRLLTSPATIRNNTISGNSAFAGGGIFAEQSPGVVISCNVIQDNEVSSWGGGIYAGDTAQIENNVISGNSVTEGVIGGGGINAYGSGGTILNNTIVNNSAPTLRGGGVSSDPSNQPGIMNCIFWGNTGGDLYLCAATYSDIEDGNAGEGNISEDPRFLRADSNNYRLKPGSPCIDSATSGGPSIDIDGRNRPNGNGYDMGAYEFYPISTAPINMLLLSEGTP